ncbi:MAG: tetratricopeptide repeat protein [Paludibacter sp.]|nr:tetratricopeptide repeat protein [Paludibacter sp.]
MKNKIFFPFFIIIAILLNSCSVTKQVSIKPKSAVTLSESALLLRDSLFYEAIRFKFDGDYDSALETLLRCNEIDSVNAEIHSELGMMFLQYHNIAKALGHLQKAVEITPDDWWYSYQLISLYMDIGDEINALELAEQTQKFHPQNKQIYPILAAIYIYNKDIKRALKAYDDLEKLTGMSEDISIEKFKLHLQNNDTRSAFAEIERLIDKYPYDVRYKLLKANLLMQSGQKDAALEVFEQVRRADPQSPLVYVSLADYYMQENKSEEALEMVTQALKNDNLDIETKLQILGEYIKQTYSDESAVAQTENLLKLLIERYPLEEQPHAYYYLFLQTQNRQEEAIAELEAMININPKNEKAWGEFIQFYLSQKNYEKAITTSDEAIEMLPDLPQFYYFKTIANFQLENFEQTISTAKKGISLLNNETQSFSGDFYSIMADAFYKINLPDSAFVAYDNALLANPTNLYVMNNYAYYLALAKRDLRKAETMSSKTVEAEPNNPTFLDTYAWILYERESYSLAKLYIEKAISNLNINDQNGVIYDHYGDILLKNDNREKAVEMWKKAIDEGEDAQKINAKILAN